MKIKLSFLTIICTVLTLCLVMPCLAQKRVQPNIPDLSPIKERLKSGDPTAINSNPSPRPEATLSETEPNDSWNTANSMNIGDTANGVINPAGDVDYYKFTGSADEQVFIRVSAYVNGSPLDSVVHLYDSDGVTKLAKSDDSGTVDSFLVYVLPHAGTFYIRIKDYNDPPNGGPSYFYSLTLAQTGTISGTISMRPPGTTEGWTWCPNVDVYTSDGYFLLEGWYCPDQTAPPATAYYSLPVPSNMDLKVHAYEPMQNGAWYNQKYNFGVADTLRVEPGATLSNINFAWDKNFEIYPTASQWSFNAGDTLSVDLKLKTGAAPVSAFLKISMFFPENGVRECWPTGIQSVVFFGPIQLPANTDQTVQFIRYPVSGTETPGGYGLYCEVIPAPGVSYGPTWFTNWNSSYEWRMNEGK